MRRALALACAAAVSVTSLAGVAVPGAEADPGDGEASLRADADGPLRIRKEGGVATSVSAPVGTDIDNPAVGRGTALAGAGRAHLRRYGAALGADRPGTRLVEERQARTAGGSGVVRYQQRVGGVPVLGGEVVVTVGADRDLTSLQSNLSTQESVAAAAVSEATARATAIGKVARSRAGTPVAEDQGRWLLDPAAVPLPTLAGPRTAWRFEVRSGPDVRRLVAVDDRTGDVLLDVDLIQHDRVVCDQKSVQLADPPPCTAGFARVEGSSPSSVTDVNEAFVHAGLVSQFYAQFGTPAMQDLTALIGAETQDGKRLASTVRVCLVNDCPYDNAYWNGEAMFYGANYPRADDIVGHEMTHGVIERRSGLLYWGQSGAINESLADIIGELIDHRDGSDDDSAWLLGEDVPGDPFRSAADPTIYGDPDKVTSPKWYSGEEDNAGVHLNSGVGNKTAYLISQGGTFNGHTLTGIDAGDPSLAKSARLWPQVIESIPSFAEYDDLASVLDAACATLVTAGTFTAADCTAVHEATLATELTTRPANEPDPTQPARTCPDGTFARVLLGSETGTAPETTFTAAKGGWFRLPSPAVPAAYVNTYSGGTGWFGVDDETGETGVHAAVPLRATSYLTVPAGQPTYLAFKHWHVFDYDVDYAPLDPVVRYWDGGSVELLREGVNVASPLEAETWVNGPNRTLMYAASGRTVFAGTSQGWTESQVDLTSFAGQRVKPQFTMHYDESWGAPGWYLDDVEVITCDPPLVRQSGPSISGTRRVGSKLTALSTWSHPDTVRTHQWFRNGVKITGATASTYTPVAADLGRTLSVQVGGRLGTQVVDPATATAAGTVAKGVIAAPSTVKVSGTPYVGRRLSAVRGTWSPSGIAFTYRWLRDGKTISGATASSYVLRKADKGHRVTVRITGAKAGYTTVSRTAASVAIRR